MWFVAFGIPVSDALVAAVWEVARGRGAACEAVSGQHVVCNSGKFAGDAIMLVAGIRPELVQRTAAPPR